MSSPLLSFFSGRFAGRRTVETIVPERTFNDVILPPATRATLDQALSRLAEFDPEQAHIVELRYFGGLTVEETASALGISENTVIRDWSFARAWLRRELGATSA